MRRVFRWIARALAGIARAIAAFGDFTSRRKTARIAKGGERASGRLDGVATAAEERPPHPAPGLSRLHGPADRRRESPGERTWKRRLVELAVLVAFLLVAGALVVVSGVVSVRASPGHWPPTRWFLEFAMRRSVSTWSSGIEVPPLDDPALIRRGAGHYDIGCQPCHGAPGRPSSAVARELTPAPPVLPELVTQWESAELFSIVRHGVKMTGMPAWPSQSREDEVWAIVAFLRRLPELDPAGYRALALGDMAEADSDNGLDRIGMRSDITAVCARCHGSDGLGDDAGAFPRIAGQRPAYLAASLAAYAAGGRCSGIMETVALALDSATVQRLATHYARATPPGSAPAAPRPADAGPRDTSPRLVRGEDVARYGVPAARVPSCVDCHGPTDLPRNRFYPDLAGQNAAYLVLQLRLFRERRRGGTPFADIMRHAVHDLDDADADAVAAWYAALPWTAADVAGDSAFTGIPLPDRSRDDLGGPRPAPCGPER